jgi:hypothetical protein
MPRAIRTIILSPTHLSLGTLRRELRSQKRVGGGNIWKGDVEYNAER